MSYAPPTPNLSVSDCPTTPSSPTLKKIQGNSISSDTEQTKKQHLLRFATAPHVCFPNDFCSTLDRSVVSFFLWPKKLITQLIICSIAHNWKQILHLIFFPLPFQGDMIMEHIRFKQDNDYFFHAFCFFLLWGERNYSKVSTVNCQLKYQRDTSCIASFKVKVLCVKITHGQVLHLLLSRNADAICGLFCLSILIPSLLLSPPFFHSSKREATHRRRDTLDLDLSIIPLLSPSIILYLAPRCPILTPEWGWILSSRRLCKHVETAILGLSITLNPSITRLAFLSPHSSCLSCPPYGFSHSGHLTAAWKYSAHSWRGAKKT